MFISGIDPKTLGFLNNVVGRPYRILALYEARTLKLVVARRTILIFCSTLRKRLNAYKYISWNKIPPSFRTVFLFVLGGQTAYWDLFELLFHKIQLMFPAVLSRREGSLTLEQARKIVVVLQSAQFADAFQGELRMCQ